MLGWHVCIRSSGNSDMNAPRGQTYSYSYTQAPASTYYSIDVECVAVGYDHNARAVAQISLVNQYEKVVLNLYVLPQTPVVS